MDKIIIKNNSFGNSNEEMSKPHKKNNFFILAMVLVLSIVAIILIYLCYKNYQNIINNNQPMINSNQSSSSSTIDSYKMYNTTLSEFKNDGYKPTKNIEASIPLHSEATKSADNTQVTIHNNDFSLTIKTIYDRTGVFLEEKLNKVKLYNNNFEGTLYRVYYNNEYVYSNKYGESDESGCIGYDPTPVACLLDMVGPFIITCNEKSNLSLEECDKIVESLKYELIK
ncbi:hypothetical protein A2X44_02420 [candidate division CPR3 bacterium GWF2_35_18]|uniref:Uncharacterized protein n=1 Tax=candidate division CPR3 bacterium GW2011_GWF2_35_18 TaxID=1618350 RepID=A0A0G0ERR0_UNCC3|nr:MAG: hypothetical protein UR67_C0002G0167 [candidate division CPR3 bacterium GW2011_GWF2_35_18]KKP85051.1 MAG: hypothetical protein UR87_C0061G0008 [candidate division CPR3 bacterium GW2011_GWE2_35_7]OGB62850.1 MAG: hypothetical protein A2X44_02420 [candidate division CPR3 bacterium GWF2_35_18]OGB65431.1 MAG: hypothetical protein A2250_00635 [candidate division CPR3 bacterium RIFOXYA2_FULL_35_13]OGB77083.1 MAG: hypothetical protein A2476_02825 [candidate division CPR3 bacterium RIFOXYC2_FULL